MTQSGGTPPTVRSPSVYAAQQATAQSEWSPFWQNLKQGFDLFERDGAPPKVAACEGSYVFGGDAVGPGCKAIAGWV